MELTLSFKGSGDSYFLNGKPLDKPECKITSNPHTPPSVLLQFCSSIPIKDLPYLKQKLSEFSRKYGGLTRDTSIRLLLWGDNKDIRTKFECLPLQELYDLIPYNDKIDTLIIDGNLRTIKEKKIPKGFTANLKSLIIHGFKDEEGIHTMGDFNSLNDFNDLFEADEINVNELRIDMNAEWSKLFKIKTKNIQIDIR